MNAVMENSFKVLSFKREILDVPDTNKFTAIYNERILTGFGLDYIDTLMKRIEKQDNETLEQMLEREEVSEGLVFLFHGHSQMQGE
jgi:hypothetical protein